MNIWLNDSGNDIHLMTYFCNKVNEDSWTLIMEIYFPTLPIILIRRHLFFEVIFVVQNSFNSVNSLVLIMHVGITFVWRVSFHFFFSLSLPLDHCFRHLIATCTVCTEITHFANLFFISRVLIVIFSICHKKLLFH